MRVNDVLGRGRVDVLRLVQATSSQIIGYDNVSDGVEYKLDVVGVGGAGHVTVNLLRR